MPGARARVLFPQMKILLRHTRTAHYYMGKCSWTTELADAQSFKTLEQALQTIIRDGLDGMSLVIFHIGSEREQVFDLTSETQIPELK